MRTFLYHTLIIAELMEAPQITIFNAAKKKQSKYIDISKLANKKINVYFDSREMDGSDQRRERIVIEVPALTTEKEVQDFIVEKINEQINP
jgi:hypothetical protein